MGAMSLVTLTYSVPEPGVEWMAKFAAFILVLPLTAFFLSRDILRRCGWEDEPTFMGFLRQFTIGAIIVAILALFIDYCVGVYNYYYCVNPTPRGAYRSARLNSTRLATKIAFFATAA